MRQQANGCTLLAPCVLACRVGVIGASVFLERSISFTANSRTGFKKLAHL